MKKSRNMVRAIATIVVIVIQVMLTILMIQEETSCCRVVLISACQMDKAATVCG